MERSQAAAAGVFLAVLLGGIALVVIVPRVLRIAAGPDAEVIAELKATEKTGLTLEIPGAEAPLVTSQHRYDRFIASLEPTGDLLRMAATLELQGKLGRVRVGAFTVERLEYVPDGSDWTAREGTAPALVAVLAALEKRRRALEAFDRPALEALRAPGAEAPIGEVRELELLATLRNRRYETTAWYVRVEGEEAVVTEDYRLMGDLPSQPVDRKASRRLLLRKTGPEFFFWPSLM